MGKLCVRCYFHPVSCDGAIFDATGIEVVDFAAAEAEALRAIQELREEDGDEAWRGWQLNVSDQLGCLLLTLPLAPTAGAAARRE